MAKGCTKGQCTRLTGNTSTASITRNSNTRHIFCRWLESMEELIHGLRLLGEKYNPGDHAGLQPKR